jgi:hypothetical protein
MGALAAAAVLASRMVPMEAMGALAAAAADLAMLIMGLMLWQAMGALAAAAAAQPPEQVVMVDSEQEEGVSDLLELQEQLVLGVVMALLAIAPKVAVVLH